MPEKDGRVPNGFEGGGSYRVYARLGRVLDDEYALLYLWTVEGEPTFGWQVADTVVDLVREMHSSIQFLRIQMGDVYYSPVGDGAFRVRYVSFETLKKVLEEILGPNYVRVHPSIFQP